MNIFGRKLSLVKTADLTNKTFKGNKTYTLHVFFIGNGTYK